MSITSANAIFTLAIAGVYNQPVRLQNFAADDIFSTDAIQSAQVLMGVDGRQATGFVFVSVPQQIALMADSQSAQVFENWWTAMQVAKDTFVAQGVIILPGIRKKWTMNNGSLTSYKPIPDASRLLREFRHQITWESIQPNPI